MHDDADRSVVDHSLETERAIRAHEGLLADYLSERQAAAELGVTSRTLWRWRKQRAGPAVTFVGSRVMYRRQSILAWLLSREQTMPRARRRARATV